MGQCLKKSRSEAKKEEVNIWLHDNGLGEYSVKFKEHGWDEISLLLEMTDSQVEMCIPKPGHVVKFKRALDRFGPKADDLTNMEMHNTAQSRPEPAKPNDRFDSENGFRRREPSSSGSESGERGPVTMAYVHKLGSPDKHDVIEKKSVSSEDDSYEEKVVAANRRVANADEVNLNLKSQRTEDETSSISSEEMSNHSSRMNNAEAQDSVFGQMEMIAKWYEKKDQLYVEIKAFDEFKCILDEVHWATLLGKPGDGKSAMAAHLMLKYREKGYQPMFLSSAQEWNSLVSGEMSKQFVIIDDIFGTAIVDKRKADDWLALFESMVKVIKERQGDLLVVFTSRRYIFTDVKAEVKKFKFFEKYFIVDMTQEVYQLSPDEKEEIFNNFSSEYGLPERDLIDIRNVDSPHGFPHSVELYCTNVGLRRKKGSSFFDDPVECIKEEIRDFKDNDCIKYVVLLLILVHNNHLDADYFDTLLNNATDDEMKIFQDAGLSLQTDYFDVSNALDELEQSYLAHGSDGAYCLNHEILMEILASFYISVNPSHAIMILDFLFILAFINDGSVNAGNMKDTQRAVISCLPAGSAQVLAKRITKELKQGNMIAVGYCAAWRDQSFVREWIKYVTTSVDNKAQLAQMLVAQSEVTTL